MIEFYSCPSPICTLVCFKKDNAYFFEYPFSNRVRLFFHPDAEHDLLDTVIIGKSQLLDLNSIYAIRVYDYVPKVVQLEFDF